MSAPPESIKLYHITHVHNLERIAREGLLSDIAIRQRGGPTVNIGMPANKARRLRLPVRCHPGDVLGGYVPFNFCPRSVMLYILHMGNHPRHRVQGRTGTARPSRAESRCNRRVGGVAWQAVGVHERQCQRRVRAVLSRPCAADRDRLVGR